MNFRIWDKALSKWVKDYVAGTHAMTETYISLSGDVVKFSAGFPEDRDDQPVWSKEADSDFYNGKWWRDEERYIVQRGLGMNDINGDEIFEGDIVIEYLENRQIDKIDEHIHVVREDLPREDFKDVVLHEGVIEYCAPSFWLKYTNKKDGGSIGCGLFYNNNYEVVGNIFENRN